MINRCADCRTEALEILDLVSHAIRRGPHPNLADDIDQAMLWLEIEQLHEADDATAR